VLGAAVARVEELADFTAARARAKRSAELAGHVGLYRADVAHLRGAGAGLLDR
jgi:hypothetical protein